MSNRFNDPELCAEINKLSESVIQSNKKIDKVITAQGLLERQVKEVITAFPDGIENHREYHEAVIKAKKAEEEFWIDLKKEILKKGLFGVLIIAGGLLWIGVQGWLKITLGR